MKPHQKYRSSLLISLSVWALVLAGFGGMWWYYRVHRGAVQVKPSELLRVGINAEYPPFTYMQDGLIVGFDIELITEVAKRLGKQIEFKDMSFTALIPQLTRGGIDVIVAGLTPTPEREQQVLFSRPYLVGDPLLVISKKTVSPVTSVQDLFGKSVVVNEGYTGDLYLSTFDGIELTRLAAASDGFLALQRGKTNYFVLNQQSAAPYFKQHGEQAFNVFALPGTEQTYAFACAKRGQVLCQQIDRVLLQMEQDGFLADLKKKWGFA